MLLPAACSPAPAAYGSAAAATSCRESELCTGTLALEGCASVSGRHDRGDEAGAAAFVRISQVGQGRPQQHGWLACGSESGGLAYGSAWVGLACGSGHAHW